MSADAGYPPLPLLNLDADSRRLWRRVVRNILLGTGISVLPSFAFYRAAFSYSSEQLVLLFRIFPFPVLAAFLVDFILTRFYLGPLFRLSKTASPDEAGRVYTRLHSLPIFSFVRVFGPHALTASAVAQAAVLYANARWGLGVPSSDYSVYWLLNLTLVPIGHAVFEYHANGWAAREPLARLAASLGSKPPRVRRLSLAARLAVFFTLLAVSPLLLLAAAVKLHSGGVAPGRAPGSEVALTIAGVAALNLLLLFLFAADINRQTRTLILGLERVERGDLSTRVDLFSEDEFGQISSGVNRMIRGLRERQRLHELFGIYLSPEISRAILEGGVKLEGEAREVSVLFCDIRDFTRLSGQRAPSEVVVYLNDFFSRMASAVHARGGTINKFLGDGFLVVFGAPVHQPDHARRAVEAALAMEAELRAFNADLARQGQPPIEIGVGVDSGEVIAGNVGALERLEYTVIGDAVNCSSRIEQLNKSLGTRILISEMTYRRSGLEGGRLLPPVSVKGIEEPLRVVAVGEKAGRAP